MWMMDRRDMKTDGKRRAVDIALFRWEGDEFDGRWSDEITDKVYEFKESDFLRGTGIAVVANLDGWIKRSKMWMHHEGCFADGETDHRITIIKEKEWFEVSFEGGESRGNANILNLADVPVDVRDGEAAVNFMLCNVEDEDGNETELYAEWYSEYDDPEDAGYAELKEAILEQADGYGIPHDKLHFFCDDWSIVTKN